MQGARLSGTVTAGASISENHRASVMAEPDSPARGGTRAPRGARSLESERSWRRARRARPRRALRPDATRLPAPPEAMIGMVTAAPRPPQQVQIVARPGAVAIHGGEQDLAGAERLELPHPADGLERVCSRPAVHHHVEPPVDPLHIDCRDRALAAEALRQPGHQRRIAHRRGIDRDLVGPRPECGPGIGHGANAAADRERDEDRVRDPGHHLQGRAALVGARGDVEEHQLVGALAS